MTIFAPTAANIARFAADLRAGWVVAFATETVYGLGADATNDRAVAAIFEAKGRPAFNPLIAHVLDAAEARRHVVWNDTAERLTAKFWPGPLTLVLPRVAGCRLSLLASAGLDTAAVRAPSHPTARALIAASGVPIAAPSANRSGAISPTRPEHVVESLGNAVDLVIDGGPCDVGLESTVLDLTTPKPTLLRHGGTTREAIESVIGAVDEGPAIGVAGTLHSPGQLESHYAPRVAVRLNATAAEAGETSLGFGQVAGTLNLSSSGDLVEAAANLFAMLRALDTPAISAIAVAPIPEKGLGIAINDRLRRAAAPRPPS
jgi:L-threonylcarbamoyladenylate synthase